MYREPGWEEGHYIDNHKKISMRRMREAVHHWRKAVRGLLERLSGLSVLRNITCEMCSVDGRQAVAGAHV